MTPAARVVPASPELRCIGARSRARAAAPRGAPPATPLFPDRPPLRSPRVWRQDDDDDEGEEEEDDDDDDDAEEEEEDEGDVGEDGGSGAIARSWYHSMLLLLLLKLAVPRSVRCRCLAELLQVVHHVLVRELQELHAELVARRLPVVVVVVVAAAVVVVFVVVDDAELPV